MADITRFDVRRGGMELHGTVDGEGPELLFLHGLNASAAIQRPHAPVGYRVAAYDQRGHGSASPVTEPEAYAIGEFVADALAVLDHLGWARPVVCGSSMGAAVALRLALDHPDRVRALALVSPAFGDSVSTEVERFEVNATVFERAGFPDAIPLVRTGMQSRGLPPEATAWIDAWVAFDARSLAAANRTVGRWAPFPDIDRVAELAIPIVIACWPDDPMHPIALAERIAALADAPVARLASVAEALAHPERVGAAIKPLLDAELEPHDDW